MKRLMILGALLVLSACQTTQYGSIPAALSERAAAVVQRYDREGGDYLAVSDNGQHAVFAELETASSPFNPRLLVCRDGGFSYCEDTRRYGGNALLAALEECRALAGQPCRIVAEGQRRR